MPDAYYIDTCSLQWRYLNGAPSSFVDTLLDGVSNRVVTGEITVLEWSSALASAYRRGDINREAFKRNEVALMTDIALNKLTVLPPDRRAVEKARYLVELVGVDFRLALLSGDAIQLVYALGAAKTHAAPLPFITSDHRFANAMRAVAFLKTYVSPFYLSPQTGSLTLYA